MKLQLICIALAALVIGGCSSSSGDSGTDTKNAPSATSGNNPSDTKMASGTEGQKESEANETNGAGEKNEANEAHEANEKGEAGASKEQGETAPEKPQAAPSKSANAVSFADVKTILEKDCVSCHGGGMKADGIDLSSYEAMMKGGDEGKIVVPGDPAKSMLAQSLHGSKGVKKMPMGQPLSNADIARIEAWIRAGAKK